MNRKGIQGPVTIMLFIFIFAAFFLILFLGIGLFGFNLVNEQLDQNITIGQVNLQTVNLQTFGALSVAFATNADILGIAVLLGMSLFMISIGFFLGRDNSKIWIVADIFILIFAFILAVYISQIYDLFINATDVLDVYIEDLPRSSKFILNLPGLVATIGALIMIVSYSEIAKRKGTETNVLGF